jgi:hypothetical protein
MGHIDGDACHSSTASCQNNGTCVAIDKTLFRCLCIVPFYGNKCQYKDHCYEKPCKASEVCQQLTNNTFNCQPSSSSSSSSRQQLSPFNITCPHNYCNSNGICIVNNPTINKTTSSSSTSIFTCNCFAQKTGPRCQIG